MRAFVGYCFQRTTKPNTHKIISCRKAFFAFSGRLFCLPILLNGALENSTLRNFFKIQKHYNLTYFSQKLFFNVKITSYKYGVTYEK